jgi:hypothetical protein
MINGTSVAEGAIKASPRYRAMHSSESHQEQRANFLGILLALLLCCAILTLLFAACGGIMVYVLAVIGGTAVLGYVHYLFWGRSLNREVAGEREDDDLRERFNADEDAFGDG